MANCSKNLFGGLERRALAVCGGFGGAAAANSAQTLMDKRELGRGLWPKTLILLKGLWPETGTLLRGLWPKTRMLLQGLWPETMVLSKGVWSQIFTPIGGLWPETALWKRLLPKPNIEPNDNAISCMNFSY